MSLVAVLIDVITSVTMILAFAPVIIELGTELDLLNAVLEILLRLF